MVDRLPSSTTAARTGIHAESLDTSLSPQKSLIAENVDPLRHANSPQRLSDRGEAIDTASRPTHTLEEIAEDATHGRFDKFKQAMFQVYPSERPYAQDLSQLVSEITSRMIRAVPEEMSGVNPEEVVVHLVDSSTVNAFVTTTSSGSFDVYINRGLINEFLSAPEFAEKDLHVDALAGVVAHEICHTNFQRKYSGRANSMVQEEYCDILPAKMLERIGLRPEAMSKLCDLFSRIGGRRKAFAVSREEPHASPPIRKEVYEKGAWAEYERERRKHLIEGASSSIDALREGWRDRLEAIIQSSQDDRIVTPLRFELERKGFATADCDGKLEIIYQVMEEYRSLISRWSAGSLSRELATVTVEALSEAKGPVGRYSQHPVCVKLSALLYNQSEGLASVTSYQAICQALGVENFGAFANADEKYLALVGARTKDEVIAALKGCEQLLSYDAQPEMLRESWGGVLLPRTRDNVSTLFSAAELEAVKQGRTIPFPFGAHRALREELLSVYDGERYQSAQRALNVLAHFYKVAGLEFATECLRGQVGTESFSTITLNPARHLMRATESGTLQAFDIDLERGISLRYPGRRQVTLYHNKGAALESEIHFAEFVARRGAELLPEVARLDTRRAFVEFAFEHAHLIMPQVHPVGSLPEELTRRSHGLAHAMMERLEYLVTNDTTGEFTDTPINFLTKFNPMSGAPFLDVYRDYHRSVVQFYDKGCRVDPKHPIVRALLDNVGGVLTPAQQIVGISALNGFNGDKTRITGDRLHTAFQEAVGGEEKLRSLLGVDLSRSPAQFIEGLVRIADGGTKLYTNEYVEPALPVFEVRARYIGYYLSQGSPDRFTVEQLHTLCDLCADDSAGRALGRRIRDLVTQRAQNQDLAKLSNGEFLEFYQRIVAMGITDRNVSVERRWQHEVMRRYDTLSDVDARAAFLAEISFPRPFSCGEANRLSLLIGRYDTDRFKGFSTITSAYLPKASDPRFERFTIDGLVDVLATQVRARSGKRFDDRTPEFLKQCENLLLSLDRRGLQHSIRSRVLRGVADELLLQREASFLFRDNLTLHSKYQSQLTFANFMTATHQDGASTNAVVSEAHNRLVGLRDPSEKPFRETLFRFLLDRRPDTELPNLSAHLLKKLEGRNPDDEGNLPQVFKTLGMVGVQGFLSPEDGEHQREIVEYHLRSLHERFLELDVKAKGAALSMIAVDTSPSEESFTQFKNEALLPRILPEKGAYNELLVSAINDYFEFYGNALHHKYMVACAILASTQEERSEVSELANVGLVAKSFLGSHGTAGYKLLQRIRNHPTTPQEIKDVLHNVLDETISLPRWTIHERIEELGPQGATEHWVGSAKAGSMCLSVPLRRTDGTESYLSIIHPGAQVDSLYWLQNFTTMASNLAQIKPELGAIAPMAQQTRRLIANETEFAHSPKVQQEIAERGYTYSMTLPDDRIVIRSSCAPLISSEARPHPSDFMKHSGNKEAARVRGSTLLEMVAEFREKSGSGAWTRAQRERRYQILSSVAFSVVANEIRLIASGQGKDHDRHPGNYLIEAHRNPGDANTTVELHHFDFGCTDMDAPSATVRKELSGAIGQVLKETSLVTMIFRPNTVADRLAAALFDKGTYMPEVASIPLGLLAATGANERVTMDGKERSLLDDKALARAFKAGLEGASIPADLRIELPTGIKGWFLKRAFQRIDTKGARFV
jgi:hypothetical protein